jgi:hypothetical protein
MAGDITSLISTSLGIPVWAVAFMFIWSLVWKALALWKAARQNSPIWFIALLIFNTLGILPILYIYIFSKMKRKKKKRK